MNPFFKLPKRKAVLLGAAVILAVAAAGGTLAFMTAKIGTETNRFDPGIADITVSEPNGSSYVLSSGSDTVEKIVAITNRKQDHAIPVYVRAKLVPILRYSNGDEGSGEQVTVRYPEINATDWTEMKSDGFYYYKGILQPGDTTKELIRKAQVVGGLPQGRKLEIQVIADSIQTIAGAEQDAWKMKYSNGDWEPVQP